MLPKLLKVEKDKVVERKNNMSKYNLTDILNEYIGGGRIGTLRISYKDLVDKMDELENQVKSSLEKYLVLLVIVKLIENLK